MAILVNSSRKIGCLLLDSCMPHHVMFRPMTDVSPSAGTEPRSMEERVARSKQRSSRSAGTPCTESGRTISRRSNRRRNTTFDDPCAPILKLWTCSGVQRFPDPSRRLPEPRAHLTRTALIERPELVHPCANGHEQETGKRHGITRLDSPTDQRPGRHNPRTPAGVWLPFQSRGKSQ
jgi:hypothetical protein